MSTKSSAQARGLEGRYRDRLVDGRNEPEDRGWRSNLIVKSCDTLLAALMKGQFEDGGRLYLAIGEGEEGWDSQPPSPLPDTTTLYREVLRSELRPHHIFYLDDELNKTAKPTHRLEFHITFLGRDVVANSCRRLREFGLFGGDATHRADSGYMIDYVVHPRIDLTADARLDRRVHLIFDNPLRPDWRQLPEHPVGERLAADVEGVGARYAPRLAAVGVTTIRALATLDVAGAQIDIPGMRLVELRAKARLALRAAAGVVHVEALGELTLEQLLSPSIAEILRRTGASREAVERLREQAGALQVALRNPVLRRLTVGQLRTGG